jgi:hypothetical protein
LVAQRFLVEETVMSRHAGWSACALAVAIAATSASRSGAGQQLDFQIPYGAGQNVAPVFEGWERNADGSFNMVFGYMNRNYDERPEIPIGPNNSFSPEPVDRGQPTHFYPRRQQFMFKVRVPANFGKQQLIWTLTRGEKTERAVGKLDLEWEISQVVYSQNRRGLGSDATVAEPNKPPTVGVDGAAQRTATVGIPVTLTVNASDDGVPKPPKDEGRGRGDGRGRGGPPPLVTVRQSGPTQQQIVQPSREGLAVTWTQWRGPGRLTFTPARTVVKDGKASTEVTFSQPGTYVIRAYADDGIVFEPADVTVTVAGASGGSGRN